MESEFKLIGRATYDPGDNKCRIYPDARLPRDLYERVRGAGFIWAPKQQLFVAPMWTPDREELMLDLCGSIEDDDKSLVDRAEERADRFSDYSANRAEDAAQAHKAVSAIADNIPLGQPILVGHHSEKRARRDAEKIENGMRRAVKLWDQSQYWKERAAGAIRHAKYKERPDVRARRIKGIEADKRKMERQKAEVEHGLRFWQGRFTITNKETGEKKPLEITEANRDRIVKALGSDSALSGFRLPRKEGDRPDFDQSPCPYSALSNSYPNLYAPRTVEEVRAVALQSLPRQIERIDRWLHHYENRLTYERAMLEADGGLESEKHNICIGGQVLRRGSWYVVTKVNRRDEALSSVTVLGHFASTISADEIDDYRPPQDGDWDKVKAVTKQPPICNYPGKSVIVGRFRYGSEDEKPCECVPITQAQWDETHKDYKGTRVVEATADYGRHRVRYGMFGEGGSYRRYVPVYITDAKRKDPPPAEGKPEPKPELPEAHPDEPYRGEWKPKEPTEFDALRETLKAGVQVVSAPQLFPTPPELAKRMVDLAEIEDGQCVLEPSAGTGNLIAEVLSRVDTEVLAYEISRDLCSALSRKYPSHKLQVRCKDFLEVSDFQGCYPRILMNPPFERGADIKHIKHAINFLNPGGRLVAICANGPKQQEELQPLADEWIELPEGAFRESGTNVRTAMLVINR